MSKSPLTLFFRIASKHREVYLLKIITLAIAIASSTLVILFSLNEFGYDRFHSGSHSIFRVLEKNLAESHIGNRLSNKIPNEVYDVITSQTDTSLVASRVVIMNGLTIQAENRTFNDQKIHSVDHTIKDVFSFVFVDGSPTSLRDASHTAILSSSAAKLLFGGVRAYGKQFSLYAPDDTLQFTVNAVFEDFPENSHEEFKVLILFDTVAIRSLGFSHSKSGVYGRSLSSDTTPLESTINLNTRDEDLVYKIQPLTEIYFGTRVSGEDSKHGDSYSVIILICITGFLLILALTNYVNLTTLTLPYRSKELAVKKLAGATQLELFLVFFKESLSIVLVSFLCGALLLFLTASLIEPILSINVISLLLRRDLTVLLVMGGILATLIAAPLFLTVRFIRASPNRLLSTDTITFPRLKRTITILQLGISILLIVSAIIMRRQINYSLLKEPGRNFEQVVYLDYPDGLTPEGLNRIRSGWQKYNANIVDVIAVSQLPDRIKSKQINSPYYTISVDPYFPGFFDLNMIHGNWFKANAGDSIVVVNQKGMESMKGKIEPSVIGVVEDIGNQFNQPQKPIKFYLDRNPRYNYLCVRILEVDIRRTIDYLSTFFDGAPVSILNKRFEEWLRYQDRLNTLSNFLAIVSGLLSCCAVYGLSVSLVRDKLQQIAVHKICGANTLNITLLLAREFVRSMLISITIFAPITYILMSEMLRTFVYSTHFQWEDPVFPLAYCILVIITICAFQALSLSRTDLTSALKR